MTHALLAGSPAIDHAINTPVDWRDARGRPAQDGDQDGVIQADAGAYEYDPPKEVYLPMVVR